MGASSRSRRSGLLTNTHAIKRAYLHVGFDVPVFRVEAQHLVMFVFAESGAVFLWGYMTIICCWLGAGGGGCGVRGSLFGRSLWCWVGLCPRCCGRYVWNKLGAVERKRVVSSVPGYAVAYLARWPQRGTG